MSYLYHTAKKWMDMSIKITAGDQVNFAEPKAAGDCCVQCGKPVGSDPWCVEVIDGGYIAANPGQVEIKDSGYMGFWSVGNECAKKIDRSVLFKM